MTITPNAVPQRSPEWHQARTNRLTASVAGAVLGLDPYRDRNDVMRMMVRDFHGAEREFVGNVATQHGTGNEETAKFDFQLETGLPVTDCGFFTYDDWLGASPDGMIGDDSVLEIKAPYGKRNDEAPEFKSIMDQLHYYAQVQLQLLCTGRDYAWFFQWTPRANKIERIVYNQDWIATNLPILAQFYAEYLSERDNPDHLAPKRAAIDTPQAHKMVSEYDELSEAIERATERRKELLAEMVDLGGSKDTLFAGRKLTKVEKAGAVSYAAVVKEHLPKLDLTKYRGKPSEYWKLS